ncbi:MAG: hypothetical protein KDD69_12175 [Bdellovibrionales bacterium]|nr:hypothetical protein [Bdellovibrionales bacterium]
MDNNETSIFIGGLMKRSSLRLAFGAHYVDFVAAGSGQYGRTWSYDDFHPLHEDQEVPYLTLLGDGQTTVSSGTTIAFGPVDSMYFDSRIDRGDASHVVTIAPSLSAKELRERLQPFFADLPVLIATLEEYDPHPLIPLLRKLRSYERLTDETSGRYWLAIRSHKIEPEQELRDRLVSQMRTFLNSSKKQQAWRFLLPTFMVTTAVDRNRKRHELLYLVPYPEKDTADRPNFVGLSHPRLRADSYFNGFMLLLADPPTKLECIDRQVDAWLTTRGTTASRRANFRSAEIAVLDAPFWDAATAVQDLLRYYLAGNAPHEAAGIAGYQSIPRQDLDEGVRALDKLLAAHRQQPQPQYRIWTD